MTFDLDPVYVRAAASGDVEAQFSLAESMLRSGVNCIKAQPQTGLELMAGAEVFARLAAESGSPPATALLAAVKSMQSIGLRESDPVRSVIFRETAESLFGALVEIGEPRSLTIVGLALTELAAAGDDDAAERLDRVVGMLPAESAVLLREWNRSAGTLEECGPPQGDEAKTTGE